MAWISYAGKFYWRTRICLNFTAFVFVNKSTGLGSAGWQSCIPVNHLLFLLYRDIILPHKDIKIKIVNSQCFPTLPNHSNQIYWLEFLKEFSSAIKYDCFKWFKYPHQNRLPLAIVVSCRAQRRVLAWLAGRHCHVAVAEVTAGTCSCVTVC